VPESAVYIVELVSNWWVFISGHSDRIDWW